MAIKKRKLSPRQKMINLMYVVLMAMLALNVSSEVLNGFTLIGDGLKNSSDNSSTQNEAIYKTLSDAMKQNPEKVRQWFDKAKAVKDASDSLYQYAEELKLKIAREADGKEGNPYDLSAKDNVEATARVMLAPGVGQGKKLYNEINRYRDNVVQMVPDSMQKMIIEKSMATNVSKKSQASRKELATIYV